MLVTITNPTGINYLIGKIQPVLQAALFPIWNIAVNGPADELYKFYPRVHRNQAEGAGFIAELYTGNGNYKEVYWDDSLYGLSWFGLGPKVSYEDGEQVADVHLVTFANLKKLYPTITHRADEEIRNDFQTVFLGKPFGFQLVSTEIWLPNVLREYPSSRRDDRLIKADMGTVHAFRLNLRARYDPALTCDI